VTAFAQSKSLRFFAVRPWLRSANTALIGLLIFAICVGRSGLLGVVAWVMLALAVVNGLVAIGLFAARDERKDTPRPTGRV
jgi:hypothetical protein